MITAAEVKPGGVYRRTKQSRHHYLRPARIGAVAYLARLRRKGGSMTGRDSFWVQQIAPDPEAWVMFRAIVRLRTEAGEPGEFSLLTPFRADTPLRPLKSPPPYPPRR